MSRRRHGIAKTPSDRKAICEATLFVHHGSKALAMLPRFVSENAREFYHLPPPTRNVILRKERFDVPLQIGAYRPFLYGDTLPLRQVNA